MAYLYKYLDSVSIFILYSVILWYGAILTFGAIPFLFLDIKDIDTNLLKNLYVIAWGNVLIITFVLVGFLILSSYYKIPLINYMRNNLLSIYVILSIILLNFISLVFHYSVFIVVVIINILAYVMINGKLIDFNLKYADDIVDKIPKIDIRYRIYESKTDIDNFILLEKLLTNDNCYNRQLYSLYVDNTDKLTLVNKTYISHILTFTCYVIPNFVYAKLADDVFGVLLYDNKHYTFVYILFFHE